MWCLKATFACLAVCTLSGLILPSLSSDLEYEYVTAGSVVKLLNKQYSVRLHSHEVKYGSGSGQQSVTGMSHAEDANSYWQVRSPTDEHIMRGTPIKCGQKIRLTHIQTQLNLHSHNFASPLTDEQEVSAFGEGGEGDHLDNWTVICSGGAKYWERDSYIQLQHDVTNQYLAATSQTYGRPISGQREIACTYKGNRNPSKWKAGEGVYIKPSED